MAEHLRVHPLTVDHFHSMIEVGILLKDDPVELIGGQLVEKMPIGPKHVRIVNLLDELAILRASDVVEVSIQHPVELDLYNEPQPDFVLLKVDRDATQVPKAKDILLLVDVADASLGFDQKIKLPNYAAVGIPEVWIVNIPEERLECYRRPNPSGYAVTRSLSGTEMVDAELVPALGQIRVDSLFVRPRLSPDR